MAKKKESDKKVAEDQKEEKATQKQSEKKVIKEQQKSEKRLYSMEELAHLFGVTISQMRSLYSIRGLDKNEKLTYHEAFVKFN